MTDFDRPLDDNGRADAAWLGEEMCGRGLLPDTVLCSNARRAAETWSEISRHIKGIPAKFTKSLYSGDPNTYLALVRAEKNAQCLMVIGHNPMLEDVAIALSANSDRRARAILDAGFPAGGLAVFDIEGDPGETRKSTARLCQFLAPRHI